jgi:3-oxoacyl-[acyl-carrier protein] reductase
MATVMDAPHAEMLRGQRLDGKAALVTGAGGEPGHRVAVALGELGASVALNHRRAHDAQIQAAIAQLDEAGIAGAEMRSDLASSATVASLFDQVVDRFDRLDMVVHTPGRVTKTPFAEITDEEFEASVDQNLRAAFYVLREAARRVADNDRIVTITTSITGVTTPYYSIYAGQGGHRALRARAG